jgi:DNA polymerase III epsilon subunit-like protein
MQIFLDLETTGLAPREGSSYCDYKKINEYSSCRIIQICMNLYNGDTLVDEIYSYIDPGIVIPEKVIEITKITNEIIKNKKFTKEIINKIKSFLKLGNKIIGHNIEFDIFVLASELYRMKEYELASTLFSKPTFCTMKNAYKLQKTNRYIKLKTLYSTFFTENLGEAHDAKVDVLMCKKLYSLYDSKEKNKEKNKSE